VFYPQLSFPSTKASFLHTQGWTRTFLSPSREMRSRVGSIMTCVSIACMYVWTNPLPGPFCQDSLSLVDLAPLPHIPLDNLITRSIPNAILPPPPSNHPLDMRYRLRNRPLSIPLERETSYYIDECNNQ
jgi:hypothetical protein